MCDQWVAELLKGLPTAIIVLFLGLLAVWLAHRYIVVAQAKLKLELFQKRHDIFVATWRYLSDLIQKNPVTTSDILNFSTNTASAKFLFGNEIVQFLDEAQTKGIRLGTAEYTLSWPASEEAHNQASAERHALVTWIEAEMRRVKDRFKPYLDFSQRL
jgi:hypothetical protein